MTEYPCPGSRKQPIKEPDQAQAHRCSLNFKGISESLKLGIGEEATILEQGTGVKTYFRAFN